MKTLHLLAASLFAGLVSVSSDAAQAGDVEIVNAEARKSGDSWTFSVTLRHEDTGWEHYADQWAVYSTSGDLLGERVLFHPHVEEQPFTRSLSGVKIPDGMTKVIIRARDNVDGVSPQAFELTLPD
ncbi:hypothetical protein E1180_20675 [Roseibium denhamense]|uniref:Uncharacterized protein n=1 Tax=Roseibium denhamense TaxID=76305 RepID=A0ABY1NPI5_9HYPH|nr:hypothetical protein [Roseibium denhamense]MTI07920.1 hypothetical protein [Roseibium denhamense]SMP14947.1 hypothetical protein SAMN06265374_1502 [Roseibium denhamense]